ncbi:MAG: hypothetical protein GC181_14060 [Bacteroidetes bacterium]|nr:hypothetical protein [Bacteroidota bacterium]
MKIRCAFVRKKRNRSIVLKMPNPRQKPPRTVIIFLLYFVDLFLIGIRFRNENAEELTSSYSYSFGELDILSQLNIVSIILLIGLTLVSVVISNRHLTVEGLVLINLVSLFYLNDSYLTGAKSKYSGCDMSVCNELVLYRNNKFKITSSGQISEQRRFGSYQIIADTLYLCSDMESRTTDSFHFTNSQLDNSRVIATDMEMWWFYGLNSKSNNK